MDFDWCVDAYNYWPDESDTHCHKRHTPREAYTLRQHATHHLLLFVAVVVVVVADVCCLPLPLACVCEQ
jgi:hypothetical protein